MILLLNACLNYCFVSILRPIMSVGEFRNTRKPYMSIVDKAKIEIFQYFSSFRGLMRMLRPLLILNLLYWLLVIFYIMKSQQQELYYTLVSYFIIRSYLVTLLLLQILLYLFGWINRKIAVELLASNKKQINVNLLRLDPKDWNNRQILGEYERYVWSNCETFWDGDFLAHRYAIVKIICYFRIINYLKII